MDGTHFCGRFLLTRGFHLRIGGLKFEILLAHASEILCRCRSPSSRLCWILPRRFHIAQYRLALFAKYRLSFRRFVVSFLGEFSLAPAFSSIFGLSCLFQRGFSSGFPGFFHLGLDDNERERERERSRGIASIQRVAPAFVSQRNR